MINAKIKFQIKEKLNFDNEWIFTIWKKILCDNNIFNGSVTIIISNDDFLRKLKLQFFNQDVLTDVIAFNLEDENDPIEGEIYISFNRVKENAKEYNEKFINEFKRVIIHGCLHLIGFDDSTNEEKKKMTYLENKYLNYMENS
ncbi:MAG: rRNA maturation RNase YbeY [Candidatus Neomarinimicrobiota bacterium]|nr:rRNA maturation RNase YbeY [Candidatus Neomarinimicrobiota bacterium]|tara:strand:+ start:1228 stop:1656 length:429 start_codon:yes stop_codon:yes gene_type:complete